MTLNYLPGSGDRADWLSGRGYVIERKRRVGDRTIVLGRITMHGVEKDFFVCAYDDEGNRIGATAFTVWDRGRRRAEDGYEALAQSAKRAA